MVCLGIWALPLLINFSSRIDFYSCAAMAPKSKGSKNIQVFLRIRPPVGREIEGHHTFNNLQLDPSDPTKITIHRRQDELKGQGNVGKTFNFNRVFGQDSHNNDVYKEFGRNAVDAAFDGQHGVLFVYGQTGSGKTFTISNNSPDNSGVLQQAMKEVWSRISADKGRYDYNVSVSYVQLYKEVLTNLLDDKKEKVRLQSSNDGVTMVKEVNGLPVEEAVANYTQTMDLFQSGLNRKEMACTDMNSTSSRSHTIFCLSIHRSKVVGPVVSRQGDTGDADGTATTELHGKLFLCDLAGSERASKTGATGNVLDEATSINGSLLVLGRVVAALTEKGSQKQHAPFRESKLTRILQYSLTGNGNTSLVVNVSPSDDNTDETFSAILFGQRAIQIKQDAKRHEVVDYKALYLQLQADLDSRNDKVIEAAIADEKAMYESVISGLKEQLQFAQDENSLLKSENSKLRKGGAVAVSDAGGTPIASPTSAGGDWSRVVENLQKSLAQRDERLQSVEAEKVRLALALSEEKTNVFRIAEKLRAVAIKYRAERGAWEMENRSLQGELASVRGTEYLSTDGAVAVAAAAAEDAASKQQRKRAKGGFDEQDSGEGDDDTVEMQLERAQATIRDLHEERIALIVYQAKAQKAIKMLARENIKLGGGKGFS